MAGRGMEKLGWLLLAAAAAGAATPKPKPVKQGVVTPVATVKLTAIGASLPAKSMVEQGASVLTVNLIDDKHLLVTFVTRGLVPRLEKDPDTDTDRILAGEVVEIPSGKVISKTTWHAHDEARYLWALGRGWFLLRLGKEMSLMHPTAVANADEAFLRMSLPKPAGTPVGVMREPEGTMFSLITEDPVAKPEGAKVTFGDLTDNGPKPTYTVQYFRLLPEGIKPFELAGQFRADVPLVMPMDADGYLWPQESAKLRGSWDVAFHAFGGSAKPAGKIDSSCMPRMHMVGRSEYVAFTCRGTDDSLKLRSMGLDGHETWEEDFGNFSQSPIFVTAASASRFAMVTTSSVTAPGDVQQGLPDATALNQEVRVYQNASGDLLAEVKLAPAFRVIENCDLSEDGRVLVALNGDGIDVYELPELTKMDLKDIAEVGEFAPPVSVGKVTFPELYDVGSNRAAETATLAAKQTFSAPVSSTTAAQLPKAGGPEAWGDTQQQTGTRAKPSLLKPGEKPEIKDKSAPVQ